MRVSRPVSAPGAYAVRPVSRIPNRRRRSPPDQARFDSGQSGGNQAILVARAPKVRWTTHVTNAASAAVLALLGVQAGQTVWEVGVDDDSDSDLRASLAAMPGVDLVDDDYDDVVDVVLLWWRDDDGDLVDALVDAIGPLADHGVVWLLTPKPGRDGHVEAEDIADAAPTAGLQQTSTVSAARDWQGTRLVAPRVGRR